MPRSKTSPCGLKFASQVENPPVVNPGCHPHHATKPCTLAAESLWPCSNRRRPVKHIPLQLASNSMAQICSNDEQSSTDPQIELVMLSISNETTLGWQTEDGSNWTSNMRFFKIQFPAILQHPLHGTENFRQWSMDLAEIFLIWPHDLWTTPDIAHSIQNHGFVWKSYAPKNINGLSLFFKLHVIDWVFWSHLPRTSRLMSCRNSGLKQLLHLRLLVRPMVP